ncbi:hypothetical protein SESBI_27169 [Sesbania bispinosa]|nr:hypothetical protein SESBI_27169 [Sesbania bispinosa]
MNLPSIPQSTLKHACFQDRSDCIVISQNEVVGHFAVQVNGITVKAKGHKPINEGSVKVHIWVFSAVKELGGTVNGVLACSIVEEVRR